MHTPSFSHSGVGPGEQVLTRTTATQFNKQNFLADVPQIISQDDNMCDANISPKKIVLFINKINLKMQCIRE